MRNANRQVRAALCGAPDPFSELKDIDLLKVAVREKILVQVVSVIPR